MSFHGLIPHFFLALNSIPLSGCTTAYLVIHLPKDSLIAFSFWQVWIKLLYKHLCAGFYVDMFSTPLGKYRVWLLRSYGKNTFSFVRNCQTLPKCLCHFAFPPAVNECPCCSAFLPAHGVVSFWDLSQSSRCVMVSHGCFHLQVP